VSESGSHRDLLREGGLYASLYQEQFEGGRVQWRCPDGDIMADGTVRPREPQPAASPPIRLPSATACARPPATVVHARAARPRSGH
jgi:hypothetical protein